MAPTYEFECNSINISRRAAILDTCVLIEAFLDGGEEQEYAQLFINECDFDLYIPSFVIAEAWGMIAGSRKDFSGGISMLSWVSTPGKAVILPDHCSDIPDTQKLASNLKIDYVDAKLIGFATSITNNCGLNPPIRIVTYDTRDFTRAKSDQSQKFTVYDLRTQDEF